MIVDRCKPINPGESDTIRIIMSAHEAPALIAESQRCLDSPALVALGDALASRLSEKPKQNPISNKKPSEQIRAHREDVAVVMGEASYEELGDYAKSVANAEAVRWWLDAEHERRAKVEADTLGRLDILERSQRDVLTRLPPVDHSALTGLIGDDAPQHDVRAMWAKMAIPCAERMPEPCTRVMFFVPGRVAPQRWRAGTLYPRCLLPWVDDVSEDGQMRDEYASEQVTHWMPMPGDPK